MKGEDKPQCQVSIWQCSICVGSRDKPQSSKLQAELLQSSRSLLLDGMILLAMAANHTTGTVMCSAGLGIAFQSDPQLSYKICI